MGGASAMILTNDNFCSIVAAVEKGRVIYAGIQKFVAFIMSVHIAEVLQIFACIVLKVPIMRTPIMILYLILVTDLAPSIALGLEPGQPGIMKDRPRPKEEPILLGWMWQSTIINSLILSGVIMGVYVWALNFYLGKFDVNEIATYVEQWDGDDEKGLRELEKAQTVAFISLVWCENLRAYMQGAIAIAQMALYV